MLIHLSCELQTCGYAVSEGASLNVGGLDETQRTSFASMPWYELVLVRPVDEHSLLELTCLVYEASLQWMCVFVDAIVQVEQRECKLVHDFLV